MSPIQIPGTGVLAIALLNEDGSSLDPLVKPEEN